MLDTSPLQSLASEMWGRGLFMQDGWYNWFCNAIENIQRCLQKLVKGFFHTLVLCKGLALLTFL